MYSMYVESRSCRVEWTRYRPSSVLFFVVLREKAFERDMCVWAGNSVRKIGWIESGESLREEESIELEV